jgi:hypothetical protein
MREKRMSYRFEKDERKKVCKGARYERNVLPPPRN